MSTGCPSARLRLLLAGVYRSDGCVSSHLISLTYSSVCQAWLYNTCRICKAPLYVVRDFQYCYFSYVIGTGISRSGFPAWRIVQQQASYALVLLITMALQAIGLLLGYFSPACLASDWTDRVKGDVRQLMVCLADIFLDYNSLKMSCYFLYLIYFPFLAAREILCKCCKWQSTFTVYVCFQVVCWLTVLTVHLCSVRLLYVTVVQWVCRHVWPVRVQTGHHLLCWPSWPGSCRNSVEGNRRQTSVTWLATNRLFTY